MQIRRAQDAMDAGIETVYQDLALVDTMTRLPERLSRPRGAVANPLAAGSSTSSTTGAMRASARARCSTRSRSRSRRSMSRCKGMSGGQRQCLAIARALLWGRRIVILDEPTAALGVRETEQVLDVIRDLRKHDVSVIVVCHNMQQLMSIADRITVMRLGRTIATRTVKDTAGLGDRRADHRRDRRRCRKRRTPAIRIRPESRHASAERHGRHGRAERPTGRRSRCSVAHSRSLPSAIAVAGAA